MNTATWRLIEPVTVRNDIDHTLEVRAFWPAVLLNGMAVRWRTGAYTGGVAKAVPGHTLLA